MTKLQNHRITSCAVYLLIIGLVLMPLPTIRGHNNSSQEPAGRHQAQDADDEVDSSKKKGKKDPCAKLLRREARGKEKKDKKDEERCIGGSSSGISKGDFNGDGFGDLAIGVPSEDVGSIQSAGAVNVIYGSGGGLVASGAGIPANQFWHKIVPKCRELPRRTTSSGRRWRQETSTAMVSRISLSEHLAKTLITVRLKMRAR